MIRFANYCGAAVAVCLLLNGFHTATAADFGSLSSAGKFGEPFFARIPIVRSRGNVEDLQYGIYTVKQFTLGSAIVDTAKISMQLVRTNSGEYFLVLTGPIVKYGDSVVFTLSATSGGATSERRYEYQAATVITGTIAPAKSVKTPPQSKALVESRITPSVQAHNNYDSATKEPELSVTKSASTETSLMPQAVPPALVVAGANNSRSTASHLNESVDVKPIQEPAAASSVVVAEPAPASAPAPAPASASASAPAPAPASVVAAYVNPSSLIVEATSAKGAIADDARNEEKKLGIKDVKQPVNFVPDGVLGHLAAAEDWRMALALRRSLDHYDAAEKSLSAVENAGATKEAAHQVAAVITTDAALSYVPSPAEAVLMNFYKAMSFWSLGDTENASIELSRAEYRTKNAVDRYQKEIDKNKNDDIAAKAAIAALGSPENRKLSEKEELDPSMVNYTAYADAVNPVVTYVHALYESRKGDSSDVSDAANLMNRVNGILKGHESVARDLADLNAGVRPCPKQDCIWIITEQGQGPLLKDAPVQIGINIAVPGMTIPSFKMALPQLVARGTYVPEMSGLINAQKIQLRELGNMNRVIHTEFEKRYPAIVTRSAISAAIKTVAKAAAMNLAEKKAGAFGGYLTKVGSDKLDAMTHADTRSWTQTPANWMMVRVDQATNGTLNLVGIKDLPLPPWPALIYVKYLPGQVQSPPIIQVLKL